MLKVESSNGASSTGDREKGIYCMLIEFEAYTTSLNIILETTLAGLLVLWFNSK